MAKQRCSKERKAFLPTRRIGLINLPANSRHVVRSVNHLFLIMDSNYTLEPRRATGASERRERECFKNSSTLSRLVAPSERTNSNRSWEIYGGVFIVVIIYLLNCLCVHMNSLSPPPPPPLTHRRSERAEREKPCAIEASARVHSERPTCIGGEQQ